MRRSLVPVAAMSLLVFACNSSPRQTVPPEAPHVATGSCTSEQFVACETGAACARWHGTLVSSKPCFDHAADACAALGCTHGCNLHHGTPKEVHCAPNAASSSNMKRCAGFANWACPETMHCEIAKADEHTDDAMGTCVPTGI